MKPWRQVKRKQMKKAVFLILCCAGIFLAACGKKEEGTENTESESMTVKETQDLQPELPVSEEEKELYIRLYQAMEAEDMEEAAGLLNGNEESFRTLAEKREDGIPYLFSAAEAENGQRIWEMTPLGSTEEETGLVLTRFNTAFFGTFRNGKPEGHCLAIQTVVLEEPRFTYAAGQWKDGAMNGPGVTGYRYYEDVPEGEFAFVSKEGTYAEDLCSGELIYKAGNGEEDLLSWKIQTSAGVTVLDDRWLYYAYSREYMLPSEQDEDRAYVIGEDALDSVRWSNLIQWDENGNKEQETEPGEEETQRTEIPGTETGEPEEQG